MLLVLFRNGPLPIWLSLADLAVLDTFVTREGHRHRQVRQTQSGLVVDFCLGGNVIILTVNCNDLRPKRAGIRNSLCFYRNAATQRHNGQGTDATEKRRSRDDARDHLLHFQLPNHRPALPFSGCVGQSRQYATRMSCTGRYIVLARYTAPWPTHPSNNTLHTKSPCVSSASFWHCQLC